jgi:hypothetical protein
MECFRPGEVGQHAKGDQGRGHDIGPFGGDTRDGTATRQVGGAHAVSGSPTDAQHGQATADRSFAQGLEMQGDGGEDAAGTDDQELVRRTGRDHGLQGSQEVGPDGNLVKLVHRTLSAAQETMRQTDRAQRETAGKHATLAAQDGHFEAAPAEVERQDIGVSLEAGVGAHARRRRAWLRLRRRRWSAGRRWRLRLRGRTPGG